jgi:hypothetical protein
MRREALPPLYQAGVRYKDEPRDVWRHAVDVAGEKWGDCEDLSAYRAAELRVSGEDPDARVAVYQSGPGRYHAVVARGDGAVEDPSRVLGMGTLPRAVGRGPSMSGPDRSTWAARRREKRRSVNMIGADPTPDDQTITWEMLRTPATQYAEGGFRGYVRIPLGLLHPDLQALAVHTLGPEKPTAAAAAKSAGKAAAGALLDNPALSNLINSNPYTASAAAVLKQPAVKNALKKLKFW